MISILREGRAGRKSVPSFREECGVMGVWNHEQAARLVYLGLYAMQHRGQESCGIVSRSESGEHITHRALGLVADVFTEATLNGLVGDSGIGHVRYSTTGQNLLINAQPLTCEVSQGPLAIAHNGNFVNHASLRSELKDMGAIFQGTNDTECLLHLVSRDPQMARGDFANALVSSLRRVVGAYSIVGMYRDHMYAARDPFGFRPLVLGEKENAKGEKSWILASETCALDLIGAKLVREVSAGELLMIDPSGRIQSYQINTSDAKEAKLAQEARCVFEHVYFARPDSVVFGTSVYAARKNFGSWLAKQSHVAADLVVPVPDSGVPAAIGYAAESKIPFEMGIIRNHYVGRTFIQPHQSVRNLGVKIKLNPQAALIAGQRVVVVDDSLVRGTTSQKIVALLRSAGAKEVHLRIASPPTTGPCYYGVDTPQKSQLIAAHQSVEQIRAFIGADSLAYLSLEGLYAGVSAPGGKGLCAACFDGKYPTPLMK